MRTAVLCWELGGGAGHILPLRILAEHLLKRGVRIVLVVKNIQLAERVFHGLDVAVLRSPDFNTKTGGPAARGFARLLLNTGYQNVQELTAVIRVWYSILSIAKADLVVADAAPGALLAARILCIAAVETGAGFFCPPASPGLPGITPWNPAPDHALQADDVHLLGCINQALESFRVGCEPLPSLAALFGAGFRMILGFAQTDHFGPREEHYIGYSPRPLGSNETQWPRGRGQPVFVYLHAGFPQFAVVLNQLSLLRNPVLFVAPGLTSLAQRPVVPGNILLTEQFQNIERILARKPMVIFHGSLGLAAQCLMRGIAPVIVPCQTEQTLLAWRLARQNLAYALTPDPAAIDLRTVFERVEQENTPSQTAGAAALELRDWNMAARIDECIDRIPGL